MKPAPALPDDFALDQARLQRAAAERNVYLDLQPRPPTHPAPKPATQTKPTRQQHTTQPHGPRPSGTASTMVGAAAATTPARKSFFDTDYDWSNLTRDLEAPSPELKSAMAVVKRQRTGNELGPILEIYRERDYERERKEEITMTHISTTSYYQHALHTSEKHRVETTDHMRRLMQRCAGKTVELRKRVYEAETVLDVALEVMGQQHLQLQQQHIALNGKSNGNDSRNDATNSDHNYDDTYNYDEYEEYQDKSKDNYWYDWGPCQKCGWWFHNMCETVYWETFGTPYCESCDTDTHSELNNPSSSSEHRYDDTYKYDDFEETEDKSKDNYQSQKSKSKLRKERQKLKKKS